MRFLTVEDVLELHALQLERFGGGAGIRSLPLLESAVAQPEASFGGAYLHADVFEMAAAYLFHIVQNHPFVDGNKRAGLLAALVFLDLNGHSLATADDRLYESTMNVAAGSADKTAAAALSMPNHLVERREFGCVDCGPHAIWAFFAGFSGSDPTCASGPHSVRSAPASAARAQCRSECDESIEVRVDPQGHRRVTR